MSKPKNLAKVYLSLMLTFLVPFFTVQNVFAKTEASTTTQGGITVTLNTDEDSYKLVTTTDPISDTNIFNGDYSTNNPGRFTTVKATVQVTNNNPYPVTIKNLKINFPKGFYLDENYNDESLNNVTLEANSSTSINGYAKFGVEHWRAVHFHNAHTGQDEQLVIGFLSSTKAVPNEAVFVADCKHKGEEGFDSIARLSDEYDNNENMAIFILKMYKNKEMYEAWKNGEITNENDALITQFGDYAKVLFQMPKGWDKSELQITHLVSGEDEEFEEIERTINGVDFIEFHTNHFSNYALIDPVDNKFTGGGEEPYDEGAVGTVTDAPAADITPTNETPKSEETQAAPATTTAKLKTGDLGGLPMVSFAALAILALVLCIVCGKKYRKTLLALAFCFGLGSHMMIISPAYKTNAETLKIMDNSDLSKGDNDVFSTDIEYRSFTSIPLNKYTQEELQAEDMGTHYISDVITVTIEVTREVTETPHDDQTPAYDPYDIVYDGEVVQPWFKLIEDTATVYAAPGSTEVDKTLEKGAKVKVVDIAKMRDTGKMYAKVEYETGKFGWVLFDLHSKTDAWEPIEEIDELEAVPDAQTTN